MLNNLQAGAVVELERENILQRVKEEMEIAKVEGKLKFIYFLTNFYKIYMKLRLKMEFLG